MTNITYSRQNVLASSNRPRYVLRCFKSIEASKTGGERSYLHTRLREAAEPNVGQIVAYAVGERLILNTLEELPHLASDSEMN